MYISLDQTSGVEYNLDLFLTECFMYIQCSCYSLLEFVRRVL